jgi:two-component sensor histidine kinase
VTSEHFGVEDAKSALRTAYPALDDALAKRQITIMDRHDWYTPGAGFDAGAVVGGWLAHEEQARSRGFSGYRLTGDTLWLEAHQWEAFSRYEELVNEAFGSRRMIALCTYCMGKCGASEVLDVVSTHAFAVARRHGEWQVVESPTIRQAKEELAELNATLAERVDQATQELRSLIGHKEALLQEVHHRVKNNLQVVANLLTMRSRAAPEEARQVLIDTAERVHAISAVHEALYQEAENDKVDLLGRLKTIGTRLAETYSVDDRIAIKVTGDELALPLNIAVPTALLANELMSNALKHAYPQDERGDIEVRVISSSSQGFALVVADRGVGLPALRPEARGSGLHIARALAKQVGGTLSVEARDGGGTEARLEVGSA